MRPAKRSPQIELPPIRSAPVDREQRSGDRLARDLGAVDVEPQRRAVVRRGEVRPRVGGDLRGAARVGLGRRVDVRARAVRVRRWRRGRRRARPAAPSSARSASVGDGGRVDPRLERHGGREVERGGVGHGDQSLAPSKVMRAAEAARASRAWRRRRACRVLPLPDAVGGGRRRSAPRSRRRPTRPVGSTVTVTRRRGRRGCRSVSRATAVSVCVPAGRPTRVPGDGVGRGGVLGAEVVAVELELHARDRGVVGGGRGDRRVLTTVAPSAGAVIETVGGGACRAARVVKLHVARAPSAIPLAALTVGLEPGGVGRSRARARRRG